MIYRVEQTEFSMFYWSWVCSTKMNPIYYALQRLIMLYGSLIMLYGSLIMLYFPIIRVEHTQTSVLIMLYGSLIMVYFPIICVEHTQTSVEHNQTWFWRRAYSY